MKQQKLIGYQPKYPRKALRGAAMTAAALVAMGGMTGCVRVKTPGIALQTEGMVAVTEPPEEVLVTDAMEKAFGVRPLRAIMGLDLTCVFETEEQVRTMVPDQRLLKELPGRIQNATARGRETDCVSRSFCPKDGIDEDPVCGSAHCQIADYWAKVLDKPLIHAYQASRRGGHLICELLGDGRMALRGKATLVAVSEIVADL